VILCRALLAFGVMLFARAFKERCSIDCRSRNFHAYRNQWLAAEYPSLDH
jgi:hypothetical protein